VLKTASGATVASFDAASSASLTVSGNTLTLNPPKDLAYFTPYLIEFGANAIKDLAGNPYAAAQPYNFTTETVDGLYHFFIVAFNAAPGVEYMNQLAEAYNFGLSLKEIVNIFTTKHQFTDVYPTTLSHQALASELVTQIVKSSAGDAAKQEARGDIQAALDFGLSVGDVIYNVFGNLAHKPLNDPTWGNTARQFDNEIAVARYYTETLHASTTDLGTLRAVIAPVTPATDISTPALIEALIHAALHPPALSSLALASMPQVTLVGTVETNGFMAGFEAIQG
jgi:hypothetical protein